MFYSYTPVENPNDPYMPLQFIPRQVQVEGSSVDLIDDAATKSTHIPDEEAFTFLGYVQKDGTTTGYYYVADGVQVVDQPTEINAQALDTLPSDVETELALNGEFANYQRFLGGISNMPIHTNYNDEHNYAELQAQINDLSTVLAAILEQMPMTTALDSSSWLKALATLKRNQGINTGIQDKLTKVGL